MQQLGSSQNQTMNPWLNGLNDFRLEINDSMRFNLKVHWINLKHTLNGLRNCNLLWFLNVDFYFFSQLLPFEFLVRGQSQFSNCQFLFFFQNEATFPLVRKDYYIESLQGGLLRNCNLLWFLNVDFFFFSQLLPFEFLVRGQSQFPNCQIFIENI